ncbi:hypothetical protein [Hydrocoleum sp. CS-953]|uniref:hypothetical protein n=1 Tax=Hydrocoleum sp. CS-953 TaxID=1671698 RepID=UPI00143D9123|nr:hypothetical protein [Hydrocoleum sp. CS-953]
MINLYSGNPLWLNIIADAVEDLCDRNVTFVAFFFQTGITSTLLPKNQGLNSLL